MQPQTRSVRFTGNTNILLVFQVKQLDSQAAQNIEGVGTLYMMKSRPLKESTSSTLYKSKDVSGVGVAAQHKEDMFPGVSSRLGSTAACGDPVW